MPCLPKNSGIEIVSTPLALSIEAVRFARKIVQPFQGRLQMLCPRRGHTNDQDHPTMRPKAITTTEAASCDRYAIEKAKLKNNVQIAKWTRMAFLRTGMRRFIRV